MNIDSTFLPVAQELIDSVFPTAIRYLRDNGSSYDPATGTVTPDDVVRNQRGGAFARAHGAGGVGETHELRL